MAPRARRFGFASLPALLALSAALSFAGRASAQSSTAQARALFKEARALMDREITRLQPRIDSILASYGVPLSR
jgi:hypothetical protein